MNDIELTILMPCLNEEKTVAFCIEEAKRFISENSISAEILIADNGSTDNSRKIAEEHGARVVSVPEKGYGSALIGGINAARGRYVIMGDCDQSYDFYHLDGFVKSLCGGKAFVMGDRFAGICPPTPPHHRFRPPAARKNCIFHSKTAGKRCSLKKAFNRFRNLCSSPDL